MKRYRFGFSESPVRRVPGNTTQAGMGLTAGSAEEHMGPRVLNQQPLFPTFHFLLHDAMASQKSIVLFKTQDPLLLVTFSLSLGNKLK